MGPHHHPQVPPAPSSSTSLLSAQQEDKKRRTPPRPLNQLQAQLDRHLKRRHRMDDGASSSDSSVAPPPTSAPKVDSPVGRYAEMKETQATAYKGQPLVKGEQRISPPDKEPIQKDGAPPNSLPLKKMMLMQQQAISDPITEKKPTLRNLQSKVIGSKALPESKPRFDRLFEV
eukprot:CAMPEP_0117813592 /NCGR_PEP_ID=MMETSP0948-20121206/23602_1 /TAXON_ID=44440 /ORGANISM="Chattonella subsalsa, Strain CCMP2191" /LENGTH=172 /DNA_ID=CAMNT_0005650981 /DNA_START=1664 /DNA_END=2182 /DNA_ORIENTATION=-